MQRSLHDSAGGQDSLSRTSSSCEPCRSMETGFRWPPTGDDRRPGSGSIRSSWSRPGHERRNPSATGRSGSRVFSSPDSIRSQRRLFPECRSARTHRPRMQARRNPGTEGLVQACLAARKRSVRIAAGFSARATTANWLMLVPSSRRTSATAFLRETGSLNGQETACFMAQSSSRDAAAFGQRAFQAPARTGCQVDGSRVPQQLPGLVRRNGQASRGGRGGACACRAGRRGRMLPERPVRPAAAAHGAMGGMPGRGKRNGGRSFVWPDCCRGLKFRPRRATDSHRAEAQDHSVTPERAEERDDRATTERTGIATTAKNRVNFPAAGPSGRRFGFGLATSKRRVSRQICIDDNNRRHTRLRADRIAFCFLDFVCHVWRRRRLRPGSIERRSLRSAGNVRAF